MLLVNFPGAESCTGWLVNDMFVASNTHKLFTVFNHVSTCQESSENISLFCVALGVVMYDCRIV